MMNQFLLTMYDHHNSNTANTNADIGTYCADQSQITYYEGWNFNSGNYLFTTDTK